MDIYKRAGKCNGCYACYNACPKHCIEFKTDLEGFWYPTIDSQSCVECNSCVRVCSLVHPIEKQWKQEAFVFQSCSDDVRSHSSSGGAFFELAQEVINRNGVVFGAFYDSDFQVKHGCVATREDLLRLMGSKYVQSKINDSYCNAESYLKKGKMVLFSGTPCQINGLQSYLKNEYDNLITIDIICHGVGSPLALKKYLDCRKKESGSSIKNVLMRDKFHGWRPLFMKIDFEDGSIYRKNQNEDPYLKGFLGNLFLRPSCYQCEFKTTKRISDITIADFWNIQEVLGEIDDNKGTSAVVINTSKGMNIFDAIKHRAIFKQVDPNDVFNGNYASDHSVTMHPSRQAFFVKLNQNNNFDQIVKQCMRIPLYKRIKGKIVRLLKNN